MWLIVGGLFFPRLALFFAAVGNGTYPASDMPGVLSFVLWAAIPRLLMAYYIFFDQGAHNIWFWAYLLSGLWTLYGKTQYTHFKRANQWKAYFRQTRAFKSCGNAPFEDVFEL